MKIHQLHLQNFRCFTDKTFTFTDQFNVLVGDNGKGKTAILDALAIGLGRFTRQISQGTRLINSDDVRLKRFQNGATVTLESQYPATLHYEGTISERSIDWQVKKRASPQYAKSLDTTISSMAMELINDPKAILPMIAYYGTGRLWEHNKGETIEWFKPGTRGRGYFNCLQPSSNEKSLLSWIKYQEAVALQQKQADSLLLAVKQSIKNCMKEWQDIYFDFVEDDLLAVSGRQTLPFRLLSDGQRNMLATVADIAHRAAILNPHLNEQVLTHTSGVVLIDEIDLHLHPKWQRSVVEDLRRTFPKIQFIVTTHSPFIIQSLKPGELIDLNEGEPAEYTNESIEDITENVMGVPLPQQSQRYQDMVAAAKAYYDILEQSQSVPPQEREHLKQRLDELSAPFRDDAAYQAFLEHILELMC